MLRTDQQLRDLKFCQLSVPAMIIQAILRTEGKHRGHTEDSQFNLLRFTLTSALVQVCN